MNVELPTTRRTLVLLIRAAVAADPLRAIAAAALTVLGQCWPILAALGVANAVNAAVEGRGATVAAATLGFAVLLRLVGSPPLATVAYSLQERAAARVERRVVELTCALPGVDHLEEPELLDRIAVLQRSTGSVGYALGGMLTTAATVVQLGITAALLLSLHPVAGLLGVAGLAPFVAGMVKNHLRAQLDRDSGHHWRAKKGLRILAWAPEHGPDLRLAGAAETVRARQGAAVASLRKAHDRWALRAGLAQSAGDMVFGASLVAVVVFIAHRVARREAAPGDLVMTLVLGQRLAAQMGLAIRQLNNLLQMIRSLAVLTWLEDAAAVGRDAPMSGLQPPRALASGVSIRNVSFAYANSERPVLIDIDLDLRPGQRVAVVGENGAGKTTLVSLLCGFHQPTAGAITIDGTPLPHLDQRAWQRRVTAVFQEAARLEVELGESVGTGDLSIDGRGNTAVASHERVATAVDQAGLAELVDRFPDGLDTRLGRRFPNGHEISGGQWQKVLHARSTVREQPLLRVLDEPTAALDAQSEQDLFNRILHNSADTAITVFVSHRFSTVRDADHIVVLENGRVVEQGTHDDLVQAAGAYAELYERQARHYR